jgi:hypothetical protein
LKQNIVASGGNDESVDWSQECSRKWDVHQPQYGHLRRKNGTPCSSFVLLHKWRVLVNRSLNASTVNRRSSPHGISVSSNRSVAAIQLNLDCFKKISCVNVPKESKWTIIVS